MMHGFYGPGFGLGFLNLLGTILFVVLLVAALRALMGGRGGPWGPRGRRAWAAAGFGAPDPALDAARERLARSEISPEQFEDIRAALRAGRAEPQPHEHMGPPWAAMGRWGRDGALETARLRLARGEVTPEEFEAIRRALEA
jgi:putative membrane protein